MHHTTCAYPLKKPLGLSGQIAPWSFPILRAASRNGAVKR